MADEKADKQELLAANAGVYTALNALFKGEVAAMEQVWSHSDDVNYMGPNGLRLLRWKAVLADWKTQALLRYICRRNLMHFSVLFDRIAIASLGLGLIGNHLR